MRLVMESMEDKSLKAQVQALSVGDLVCVEWNDASKGKSLEIGVDIDTPVNSWGVFIGVMGKKSEHIILCQNDFLYTDGVHDIDYTAIPVAWTISIRIIEKNHVAEEEAKVLLSSFLIGGRRPLSKRTGQRRIVNHGRHD
jgi:hypothetical protein